MNYLIWRDIPRNQIKLRSKESWDEKDNYSIITLSCVYWSIIMFIWDRHKSEIKNYEKEIMRDINVINDLGYYILYLF